MPERRRENRLLCADILEVEWTEQSGHLRIATALLEDIAATGACLQMETAVDEGVAVELLYQGITIPAQVLYCVYREIGYFLGVDFRDGFRWSSDRFLTQHLLDLRKLAADAQES